MKKTAFLPFLVCLFCLLTFYSCQPYPEKDEDRKLTFPTLEVNLPDAVTFGKSVVYLNGEVVEQYKPNFKLDTIHNLINYSFLDTSVWAVSTHFFFSWVLVKKGYYQVHALRDVPELGAYTTFLQLVDGDLDGYSYDLVDPLEGFLYIEELDTDKMEVKGSFRVKFKRTSTNGNGDLGLPEEIQYDGVFYDKIRFL